MAETLESDWWITLGAGHIEYKVNKEVEIGVYLGVHHAIGKAVSY